MNLQLRKALIQNPFQLHNQFHRKTPLLPLKQPLYVPKKYRGMELKSKSNRYKY